ncbi:MAG: hypothetical protein ACOZBZ_03165 [Patescibacteria group bacterium]
MLELPHTIVGATIATKLGSPFLALPFAFISNFLVDLLPHWNPHLYTEMNHQGKVSKKTTLVCLVDSSTALAVGTLLALRFYPDIKRVIFILAGCFLAVLADVLEAPYFFLGVKNKYLLKFISFQRRLQWNVSPIPGILSQVVLILICFLLLFS